jgi:hypothetical protein
VLDWSQDNHNSVVLARSGAGKSYLVKLEVLRNLYDGVHVAVVDPEDEYVRPGALTRRGLFLHTVVAVLAAGTSTGMVPGTSTALSAAETAALDGAILNTYHQAGITADPATWESPAPLLADLAATLAGADDPAGARKPPSRERSRARCRVATDWRAQGDLTSRVAWVVLASWDRSAAGDGRRSGCRGRRAAPAELMWVAVRTVARASDTYAERQRKAPSWREREARDDHFPLHLSDYQFGDVEFGMLPATEGLGDQLGHGTLQEPVSAGTASCNRACNAETVPPSHPTPRGSCEMTSRS